MVESSFLCQSGDKKRSFVWKPLFGILCLFSLVALSLTLYKPFDELPDQPLTEQQQLLTVSGRDDVIALDFVPGRQRSLGDCDQLFVGTKEATFNMSDDFWTRYESMQEAIKEQTAGIRVEGHSMQTMTLSRVLHYLASRPQVRQVCETGFNMGHSAFNFLTAGNQTHVKSFDIGRHRYTSGMINHLLSFFPGRLSVDIGDSTVTIRKFIHANPNFRCDLIYVDGGHSYKVAKSDLVNFVSIARDRQTLVVFDDYPSRMFPVSFGVAWEDVRRLGYIEELMRCSFERTQHKRGFVIGRVVERPQ